MIQRPLDTQRTLKTEGKVVATNMLLNIGVSKDQIEDRAGGNGDQTEIAVSHGRHRAGCYM